MTRDTVLDQEAADPRVIEESVAKAIQEARAEGKGKCHVTVWGFSPKAIRAAQDHLEERGFYVWFTSSSDRAKVGGEHTHELDVMDVSWTAYTKDDILAAAERMERVNGEEFYLGGVRPRLFVLQVVAILRTNGHDASAGLWNSYIKIKRPARNTSWFPCKFW